MDHELAKELKDAGFPQKAGTNYIAGKLPTDPQYYAPTLEELIEACGKDFHYLVHETTWRAFAHGDNENREVRGHYKTPIEAVARLWLALNKK